MQHKKRIWIRRKDRVNQRYWIGRKLKHYAAIPLKEAKMVSLYHGTFKERVPKIMKEGLKPTSEDLSGRKAVHLTPFKSSAVHHALKGPEDEYYKLIEPIKKRLLEERGYVSQEDYPIFPEKAAVLKITLPIEQVKRESELMYLRQEKPKSGELLQEYELPIHEVISPEQIKEIPFQKIERKAIKEVQKPLRKGLVTGRIP